MQINITAHLERRINDLKEHYTSEMSGGPGDDKPYTAEDVIAICIAEEWKRTFPLIRKGEEL